MIMIKYFLYDFYIIFLSISYSVPLFENEITGYQQKNINEQLQF